MASCIVCDCQIESGTNRRDLDDISHDAASKGTLRSRLEQVLGEVVVQSGWMCFDCQSDLTQIELYYTMLTTFRQKYWQTATQRSSRNLLLGPTDGGSQIILQGNFLTISAEEEVLTCLKPDQNDVTHKTKSDSVNEAANNERIPSNRQAGVTDFYFEQLSLRNSCEDENRASQTSFDDSDTQEPEPEEHEPEVQSDTKVNGEPSDVPKMTRSQKYRAKRLHACSLCSKRFGTFADLTRHTRIHTGERPFSCSKCGKSYKDPSHLRAHWDTHSGEQYPCAFCKRPMSTRQSLRFHIKMKHCTELKQSEGLDHLTSEPVLNELRKEMASDVRGDNSLRQTVVEGNTKIKKKEAEDLNNSESHSPSEERPFICQICGKGFKKSQVLTKHLVTHSDVRPFQCSTCGKTYKCNGELKNHMEVHSTVKFTCIICGKTLGRSQSLRSHMMVIHGVALEQKKPLDPVSEDMMIKNPDGEKRFACKLCQKAFTSPSEFRRHCRVHTGERPHKCDLCEKTFKEYSHLKDHMGVHFGGFPCTLCDSVLGTNNSLRVHMKKMHSGENTCKKSTRSRKTGTRTKVVVKKYTIKRPKGTPESLVSDINKLDEQVSQKVSLDKDQPESGISKGNESAGKRPTRGKTPKKNLSVIKYETEKMEIEDEKVESSKEELESIEESQNEHGKKYVKETEVFAIHIGKKRYMCNICRKEFKFPAAFDRHTRVHTGKRPFSCHICGKAFKEMSHLKIHMNVHQEESFPCPECSMSLATPSALRQHLRKKHGTKLFQAIEANESSSSTNHYSLRERKSVEPYSREFSHDLDDSSQDTPYPNIQSIVKMEEEMQHMENELPTEFQAKASVSASMDDFSFIEPTLPGKWYVCNTCGKAYKYKKRLETHIQTNCGLDPPINQQSDSSNRETSMSLSDTSPERSNACARCGKIFSQRSTMRVHMRIHTGKKPHVCNVCQKAFRTFSSLNTHKNKHPGLYVHNCGKCGMTFRQRGLLRAHQKTHARNKCTQCEAQFHSKTVLKSHVHSHMARKYICAVCLKPSRTVSSLLFHSSGHHRKNKSRFVCSKCCQEFPTRYHLRMHMMKHYNERAPAYYMFKKVFQ